MGGPPSKKTNAKFWCEYCRVYVYDNKISRTKHDNSPQHKAALSRYVERVQKEEKQATHLKKEFEARTGVSLERPKKDASTSSSSFYRLSEKRPQPVGLLSMKGPVVVAKKSKVIGVIPEQIASGNAIVGPWQQSKTTGNVTKDPDQGQFIRPPDVQDEAALNSKTISQSDEPSIVESVISTSPDNNEADSPEQPTVEPVKIQLRRFNKPINLRK